MLKATLIIYVLIWKNMAILCFIVDFYLVYFSIIVLWPAFWPIVQLFSNIYSNVLHYIFRESWKLTRFQCLIKLCRPMIQNIMIQYNFEFCVHCFCIFFTTNIYILFYVVLFMQRKSSKRNKTWRSAVVLPMERNHSVQ